LFTGSILPKSGKSSAQFELAYPGGTLRGWPLLLIALTAFLEVVPFFFLGIPSGHDFEFHLNSWMEVVGQWRQGIVDPRWAALAHYGYGEARFIFYPPASWLLGAVLGVLLPWRVVPGVFTWLVLTLSGCSMFALARRWLIRRDAIFAAVAYAANPYYIVIVYWRSDYAELLAGALLPLLLFCILEIHEVDKKRTILRLSLVIAAAALTNVPAFILVTYSLALLALIVAIQMRSPKVLLHVLIAGVIAAALAAFYLFPVFHEQKWISIAQVLSPGVRPQDNFLFTTIADPDHNRFNRLISLVACSQLIVLIIPAFRAWRRKERLPQRMLVNWAVAASFLMFSLASPLWSHLPVLKFVQLPWRWLLCINVALVLLISISWKSWPFRAAAFLLMFGVVGYASVRIQPPWWDHSRDIAALVTAHKTGAGYEGVDEYVPAAADAYNTKPDAPLVSLYSGTQPGTQVKEWGAEEKSFSVDTSHADVLLLKLFNYPAWHAEVNGRKIQTETKEDTGQMMIPVQAGENKVQITFARTWDRIAGAILSLIAALGLLLWSFADPGHAT
jgi:hypothetical protein